MRLDPPYGDLSVLLIRVEQRLHFSYTASPEVGPEGRYLPRRSGQRMATTRRPSTIVPGSGT